MVAWSEPSAVPDRGLVGRNLLPFLRAEMADDHRMEESHQDEDNEVSTMSNPYG